ncbi:MAG TPA: TonB-dependent receptor [bacterium]|nr:TonB-dependent receptor [bacterium]
MFFIFFSTISALAQNIEIPETIVTGKDRNIYKTPIFIYHHDIQIKFPEIPKVPQQYLKIRKVPDHKKEKIVLEHALNEFSTFGGKFGFLFSSLQFSYPEWNMRLSMMNDDSFRSHDKKNVIESSFQVFPVEKFSVDFAYWNCFKEIPDTDRKKHTVLTDINFFFKDENIQWMLNGFCNTLSKVQESHGTFEIKKFVGDFTLGGAIGYDNFAGKGNGIYEIAGGYANKNFQSELVLKTIGDQTKILPSMNMNFEKQNTKLQTGISSNFDFPNLWKQIGQESYLDMKKIYLAPEENYAVYCEVSHKIKDVIMKVKGEITYEKISYNWKDIDNDNLYEPCVLKNNTITTIDIGMAKRSKTFYIETCYTLFNREKKKSGFPENMGYIKTGFVAGKFIPEIMVSYTGRKKFDTVELGGYALFSALFSYEISKNTKFFCEFNNIFNNKYREAPGYNGRPFDVIAGFQTRW